MWIICFQPEEQKQRKSKDGDDENHARRPRISDRLETQIMRCESKYKCSRLARPMITRPTALVEHFTPPIGY